MKTLQRNYPVNKQNPTLQMSTVILTNSKKTPTKMVMGELANNIQWRSF